MPPENPTRIAAIDVARTLAIMGMVVFHLTFDLELFGHIPRGTTLTGYWAIHARAVAGSFLFLAGLGLWLAHGQGIRWASFARRLTIIAGAALVVTIATRIAIPGAYVRFGILHAIAASSLLGLAFLRVPALITLAVALVVLLAPAYFRDAAFNHPALIWLGLATERPVSVDYEPLLPWFAPFLAGLACGRIGSRFGLWQRLTTALPRAPGWLTWPGRHSLAIYLIHQPVLFGLFNAVAWLSSRP